MLCLEQPTLQSIHLHDVINVPQEKEVKASKVHSQKGRRRIATSNHAFHILSSAHGLNVVTAAAAALLPLVILLPRSPWEPHAHRRWTRGVETELVLPFSPSWRSWDSCVRQNVLGLQPCSSLETRWSTTATTTTYRRSRERTFIPTESTSGCRLADSAMA